MPLKEYDANDTTEDEDYNKSDEEESSDSEQEGMLKTWEMSNFRDHDLSLATLHFGLRYNYHGYQASCSSPHWFW